MASLGFTDFVDERRQPGGRLGVVRVALALDDRRDDARRSSSTLMEVKEAATISSHPRATISPHRWPKYSEVGAHFASIFQASALSLLNEAGIPRPNAEPVRVPARSRCAQAA